VRARHQAASVMVISIEGGVLTVALLEHDDLTSGEG
jgi:hypothetical protein